VVVDVFTFHLDLGHLVEDFALFIAVIHETKLGLQTLQGDVACWPAFVSVDVLGGSIRGFKRKLTYIGRLNRLSIGLSLQAPFIRDTLPITLPGNQQQARQ
jgi:hypothetical protein